MKKLLLFLSLCFVSIVQAQYTAIPDVNFEQKLLRLRLDNEIDGKVLIENISSITSLDVSNSSISDLTGIEYFESLKLLYCNDNKLTFLDLSQNIVLNELQCENNQISSLNVSKNVFLKNLLCSNNQLSKLDISLNTALYKFRCSSNQLTSLDVSKNIVLSELVCNHNQLKSLDVNKNLELRYLECNINEISNLDVTQNLTLVYLDCFKNLLTTLDLRNNLILRDLICNSNQLSDLDVSKNTYLENLICNENLLTSLDISKNTSLKQLFCNTNQLNSLDVSNNKFLTNLACNSNQLLNLDITQNKTLKKLECNKNKIQSLFVKNGLWDLTLIIDNNPIQYICIDEFNSHKVNYYKFKANINSYCTFVPGGDLYELKGTTKIDANNNGCDASDVIYPNLKFNISDGNNSGNLIPDNTGSYNIPLASGSYTITPILENLTFFTLSPASFTANFPTQSSPLTQDICITPNGVHHDVEVVLMPKGNAVPGFETNYKLLYKNKGNQTESGQITIAFDDTVMDFVSAAVTPLKVENGLITFDYSTLQPFESKSIDLVFKMNKPTDTPALKGGDVLTFVASISGNTPEESPLDNVFTLKQTVLNSYDPNDKTCLEGNTVTPELVGQYVHYVVRFENTGTLEARNIVVKDMIDTTKFDVSSLIVTNSSHSCVTKISETNKVEFIFENINLPFDNATNDGYIAFKIKTLPSLKVGDTFSNTADIFFDYNFPITTNEAKTTVEVLSTNDFVFENYFSLYPNPAKNTVTLNSKNSIEVKNINIFNALGQLVLSIPNAQTVSNLDVSRLNIGTYFVKILTNKGTSTTKFIKE